MSYINSTVDMVFQELYIFEKEDECKSHMVPTT